MQRILWRVMRYKQAAVESNAQMSQSINESGTIFQWVADNVDHKQVALIGKDTSHGMGLISVTAHGYFRDKVIK